MILKNLYFFTAINIEKLTIMPNKSKMLDAIKASFKYPKVTPTIALATKMVTEGTYQTCLSIIR